MDNGRRFDERGNNLLIRAIMPRFGRETYVQMERTTKYGGDTYV